MTFYVGLNGCSFYVTGEVSVYIDKHARELPSRIDLINHSPTGFAWGYCGSGAAQLALALLAWEFDEQYALLNHQAFKRDVIAVLDEEEWILSGVDIRNWDADVIQKSVSDPNDDVLYNGCLDCAPPQWSDYSRLEVAPVKEENGHCEVIREESLVQMADFWSIYGRRKDDDTVEVITDAPSKVVARVIARRFARFTGLSVVNQITGLSMLNGGNN